MTTTTVASNPPTGAASAPNLASRSRLEPFHLLVPVAAFAAMLISLRPIIDPDVYWHVRLGADILRRHSVHGAGSGWTLLPPVHPWTTPEWASDVTLRGFVSAFGWRGALVFQVAVSLVLLTVLARAVLPGRDARSGACIYAVTAVSLATYLQARPQTISLVFLVWIAMQARNILRFGSLPRPLIFLPAIWVWAQFHGLWVVGPGFLAAALLLRLLDSRSSAELDRLRRGLALAVAGLAVGCVNPLGLRSLTLPFQLRAATKQINEWHATTFAPYYTWGMLLLLAALVVSWARRREVAPRAEMAWAALVFVYGLMAYRNVAVTIILLAPVVADRLSRADRSVDVSRTERQVLRLLVGGVSVAALVVSIAGAALVQPIPSGAPVDLASRLDDGTPHRVLDDYNIGGIVLAFAGPDVKVAIDGRADYFGGTYIERYTNLMDTKGDWSTLLGRLAPDTAIIGTRTLLCRWLLTHGWHQVGRHGVYSLLYKDSTDG